MRTKHFVKFSILLASLALIGAGCLGKSSESTRTNGGNPPADKPSTTTSDACGNPYYPLKAGLAITYGDTTQGETGSTDYTIRIMSVTGSKAVIRTEMASGDTSDVEVNCANGSVSMNGSTGLNNSAMEGVSFKTTVLDSSGTFMPPNVSAGTTWSNSQTMKMDMTGASAAAIGSVTVTTMDQSRAVAKESVTVPAGTFDAMKVEMTSTSTSKFSGGPSGMRLPEMAPTTTTSTEWWVKGIGMVKTVSVSEGTTSTIVAKSVTGQ